jgi:hypothetical protein
VVAEDKVEHFDETRNQEMKEEGQQPHLNSFDAPQTIPKANAGMQTGPQNENNERDSQGMGHN